jgi:hypothetical protein
VHRRLFLEVEAAQRSPLRVFSVEIEVRAASTSDLVASTQQIILPGNFSKHLEIVTPAW